MELLRQIYHVFYSVCGNVGRVVLQDILVIRYRVFNFMIYKKICDMTRGHYISKQKMYLGEKCIWVINIQIL